MDKTQLVFNSPDKKNIKYIVENADKDGELGKTLWLIKYLKDNSLNIDKTIVLCNHLKNVGTFMTPSFNVYQKTNICTFQFTTQELLRESKTMFWKKLSVQIPKYDLW